MRGLLIFGFVPLANAVLASAFAPNGLPPPEFPDTEVSQCHRLEFPPAVTHLDFSLTFSGTVSNNVEVALGCDCDGDGELAPAEMTLVLGWDCGRYFLKDFQSGDVVWEPSVGASSARSLVWHCRVSGNRTVLRRFAVTNEVGVAFAGLPASWLPKFRAGGMDIMRLTARGVEAQSESFEVDSSGDGIAVFVK